jgi:hypothetical protein
VTRATCATNLNNKRLDIDQFFASIVSLHGQIAAAPAAVSLRDVRANRLTHFLTSIDCESNDIGRNRPDLGNGNACLALFADFVDSGDLEPKQPTIGKGYLAEAAARVARVGVEQG